MQAIIFRATAMILSLISAVAVKAEVTFSTLPGAVGGNLLYPDKMEISKKGKYISHFDVSFRASFDECGGFSACIKSEVITFALPNHSSPEWHFFGWKFTNLGISTIAVGGYSEEVSVIRAQRAEVIQLIYLSKTNALLGFSSQFTDRPFAIYVATSSNGLSL